MCETGTGQQVVQLLDSYMMMMMMMITQPLHSFLSSFIFLQFQSGTQGCLRGFCDHIYILRHTVGLLWTSDQPISEASTYTGQQYINTKRQTPMPPAGFELAIPATKRPQTYSLSSESKFLQLMQRGKRTYQATHTRAALCPGTRVWKSSFIRLVTFL
jgi:hypothetical protein